jgi:hypothetical protein
LVYWGERCLEAGNGNVRPLTPEGRVLYSFSMGKRGEWSRWGRGMCEGWSLEIGTAYRGSVVRQDKIEQPPTWLASVNAAYLGEYLDRDSALARVEANIAGNMQTVLHDWGLYQAAKGKRSALR